MDYDNTETKKSSLYCSLVNECLNKSNLNFRGAYILFVLMWRLEGFTRQKGKFYRGHFVCDLLFILFQLLAP